MSEKLYDKFTVIKNKDIEKYLSKEQIATLQGIKSTIALGRLNDNKTWENKYLVVNQDEPYAKLVEKLILGEFKK